MVAITSTTQISPQSRLLHSIALEHGFFQRTFSITFLKKKKKQIRFPPKMKSMAMMKSGHFFLLFVTSILMFFVSSDAFVIEKPFTELCGRNLSLAEPNESLKVNFNVPVTDKLPLENCTAFILWTGSTDFKLLPYTARSPTAPAAGVSASPEVVLSITDVQGRLLKLAMFGSKPFYLSVTPVVRKQSLTVQEQPPQQQQSPHVVLKSSSAQLLSRKEGGAEIEIEAKEAEGKQKPSSSPLPPIIIKRCPENYVGCGLNECIHGHFACDSVAQCATDELSCFDMPSDAFLLLSFTGVMLTFGLVSLFLGLYVYVRFYSRYQPAFLLSADYKPTYYGTAVNGSFIGSNGCANGASGSSTASLSSSSSTSLLVGHSRPPRHQLYERNISLQQGQGRLLNKK